MCTSCLLARVAPNFLPDTTWHDVNKFSVFFCILFVMVIPQIMNAFSTTEGAEQGFAVSGGASLEVCHLFCGSFDPRPQPFLHLQGEGHVAINPHHWGQGLCQRGKCLYGQSNTGTACYNNWLCSLNSLQDESVYRHISKHSLLHQTNLAQHITAC